MSKQTMYQICQLLYDDYGIGDHYAVEFNSDITLFHAREDAEAICAEHNEELRVKHRAEWERRRDQYMELYQRNLTEHLALVEAGLRESRTYSEPMKWEYKPLPEVAENDWVVKEVTVEVN